MPGKLFYRQRIKIKDGSKTPRFLVVAVYDVDLKVTGKHLRMSELKCIAEQVGAELVLLPRGPKHQDEGSES